MFGKDGLCASQHNAADACIELPGRTAHSIKEHNTEQIRNDMTM